MNYREFFTIPRLWTMFAVLMVVMFGILLLVESRAFHQAAARASGSRRGRWC